MSKIADLTCEIMRKFLFPTYSRFYVYYNTPFTSDGIFVYKLFD